MAILVPKKLKKLKKVVPGGTHFFFSFFSFLVSVHHRELVLKKIKKTKKVVLLEANISKMAILVPKKLKKLKKKNVVPGGTHFFKFF